MQNRVSQKNLGPNEYGHIIGLLTATNPEPELRYTNMFSEDFDLDDDNKPPAQTVAAHQVQPLFTFGKNLNKNKFEELQTGKFTYNSQLEEIPQKSTHQVKEMPQFTANTKTEAIPNNNLLQQSQQKLALPLKKLGSNLIMSVTKPGEIMEESMGPLEQSEIIQDEESQISSHFQEVQFSSDESAQQLIPQQQNKQVYSVKVSKYQKEAQTSQNNEKQAKLSFQPQKNSTIKESQKSRANQSSKNSKSRLQSTNNFSFKKDDSGVKVPQNTKKSLLPQKSDHVFQRQDNQLSYKLKKNDTLANSSAISRMQFSQGGLKKKTQKTQDTSIKKYSQPDHIIGSKKIGSNYPQFSVDLDHKTTQPQYHLVSEVLLNKIENLEKVVSSLRSSEQRSQQKQHFQNEQKSIVEEEEIIHPKSYFQNTRQKIQNEKNLKHGVEFLNDSRPEDKFASEIEKEEKFSKHKSKKVFGGGRISDQNRSTSQLKIENKRIIAELEQLKGLLSKKLEQKETYTNLERESTQKLDKLSEPNYFRENKTNARFIDQRNQNVNEIKFKNETSNTAKQFTNKDHELQIQIPQFARVPKYSDSDSTLINLCIEFFNEMGSCLDEDSDLLITRCHDCIVCEEAQQKEKLIWYYSGDFYFGQMIFERQIKIKHGFGIEFKPNVSIYKGYFRNNKKYGNGTINYYSGQKYKGYWKNDQYHGFGLQISGESRFEGHFNENLKTGFGEQNFQNGDSYQGEYQFDKFNGKGLYRWENGSIYRGDFKKGYMHGEGVWKSSFGDRYEGEYRRNVKSGTGVYYWKNGNVYEGLFQNGRKVTANPKHTRRIKAEKQMSLDESQESFDRHIIHQKSAKKPDSNSIQLLRSHTSSKMHY